VVRALSLDPAALAKRLDFRPFRPGIEILRLYEQDGGAAAVLRYRPGARLPAHRHEAHELIYVLAGEQSDERGSYPAGTVIVNPPGSSHSVWSPTGCLVLVVWRGPVTFLEQPSANPDR
jgi:anti-sigma factor ChrR (cupin superfamily)